ncbi:hypothetical protein BRADI_3g24757v3 [Brachypodium distachyon]|uniref:Uncharacterized protein n=1 Tax=Brachypodium distachyon TaxID=15368 RepID=A0A2K2CZ80_BRADI|nr:hypothetical protein BRADI_3g24757v3 [Brachypodium distachyon]
MTINFYDSALSLASNFRIFVLQYFEIGITINQGGSYTPVVDVQVVEAMLVSNRWLVTQLCTAILNVQKQQPLGINPNCLKREFSKQTRRTPLPIRHQAMTAILGVIMVGGGTLEGAEGTMEGGFHYIVATALTTYTVWAGQSRRPLSYAILPPGEQDLGSWICRINYYEGSLVVSRRQRKKWCTSKLEKKYQRSHLQQKSTKEWTTTSSTAKTTLTCRSVSSFVRRACGMTFAVPNRMVLNSRYFWESVCKIFMLALQFIWICNISL